jgi:hypothetical protein
MSSLFRIRQVLKRRASEYTITTEIQDTVWFAKLAETTQFLSRILKITRNHLQELVVIESVQDHPRVENERNVLKRFQHRTPYLRPLIDGIDEPPVPVTIALKYLQGDLLDASVVYR